MLETTVTTGALGDPGDAGGLSWTGEPPRLPPIGECQDIQDAQGPRVFSGYVKQVDIRLDPATVGWIHGQPSGTPEMRGYFQLREPREPDAYLLALAVDSLPPVVFGLEVVGWSPTVELTWHMRALPAPGALRVAARCRHVSGGWFDEEAEVWDSAGPPGRAEPPDRPGRPVQPVRPAPAWAPAPARRSACPRPALCAAARTLSARAPHRHRMLRVVPRPGQSRLVLPRGARGIPARARPRQRGPRPAAALLRSLRRGRGVPEPPACRPLPRPVRLLGRPDLRSRRPRPADPGARPGRDRGADGPGLRPG